MHLTFNIERMYNRQDGDAECEKLFTEETIQILQDNEFDADMVEQTKQRLVTKNEDIINSLSDTDLNFYYQLISKIENLNTAVITDGEYLNSGDIEGMLFSQNSDLILWANV